MMDPSGYGSLSTGERSRYWGARFRIAEWTKNSALVIPCSYLAGAIVLALIMSQTEGTSDALDLKVDNDTARTLLSSIAGGMIAFSGLVVSVAVLVAQFAAGQYSPRLVSGFRRDRMFKRALGLFIAPAVYSLVCLREIGRGGATQAPSVTLSVAFILLAIAIVAFFMLIGRLLDLLRPRKLVERLVREGAHSATEVYPFRAGHAPPSRDPHEDDPSELFHYQGDPAVLSALDRGRLVRIAKAHDSVIEITVGVGAYIPKAASIFKVHSPTGKSGVAESDLQKCLIVGDGRTITQDPGFAIRSMVDIAIRALSPAVNDPTTAVEVLDGLETFLLALSWRDLDRGRIADRQGNVRLVFPNSNWEALLDLALSEIRIFGAGSPQVTRRMSALLDDLDRHAPDSRTASIQLQRDRLRLAVESEVPSAAEQAYGLTADRIGLGTVPPKGS
jgi:uncharacterized membrane protein